MPTLLDATWYTELLARANQPSATPRAALWLGDEAVGSVAEPAFAPFVQQAGLGDVLQPRLGTAGDGGWQLLGEPSASLARVAQAMRQHRYARVDALWRGELLRVPNARGQERARVERGAARALGITTHAVHLTARSPGGAVWVQQRSLHKPTDPGLWDTLMGGMVSAQDTLTQALVRETWEEAGLTLASLQRLRCGGRFIQRQPNPGDGGLGYVVERVDWFEAVLPEGLVPRNTDGEVSEFRALAPAEVAEWLRQGRFTLEASLVLAHSVFGLRPQLPG